MSSSSDDAPEDDEGSAMRASGSPRALRVLLVLDFVVCGFGVALGGILATSGGGFVDLSGLGIATLGLSAVACLLDLAAWSAQRAAVAMRASLAFVLALGTLALLALRLPAYPVVLGVSALNFLIFGACLRWLTPRQRR